MVSLFLAPLTAADVAAAARSEDVDGDEFVGAVRAAGAGPLDARPITLRLLLAGARAGALPSRRLDVYHTGVDGLAWESGERRLERRRTGKTTLNCAVPSSKDEATTSWPTTSPSEGYCASTTFCGGSTGSSKGCAGRATAGCRHQRPCGCWRGSSSMTTTCSRRRASDAPPLRP